MVIYLARHGSAGHRATDDEVNTARRLDQTGDQQALALAEFIGPEPVEIVISSPAVRCVETVQPTASRFGLEVQRHDALNEGTDIDEAYELVQSLARTSPRAVACSHGDVIPEIIARASGRGMSVATKAGCAKGSVWELHTGASGEFVTGYYHPLR